jgi:DNA adenine methylase
MSTSLKKLKTTKEPQLGYNIEARTLRVKAKPFIKWAGGKGQLLSSLAAHFPPTEKTGRYFEPFMGGAAVFFHLQPHHSFLSDSNIDLVELYKIVRDDVESLIDALRIHRNKESYYYKIRAQNPATLSPVERAARLIFLNKTCYNGLYRVNSKGGFNVPFGSYLNPTICDVENLRAASLALRYAEISQSDFEQTVSSATKGDFVYFDPPYQPISRTSSFTSYTSGRFDDAEQERLANVFRSLAKRDCYVMLSNSDAPLIKELYADFHIYELLASRAINSKANGRGKIIELLITNY